MSGRFSAFLFVCFVLFVLFFILVLQFVFGITLPQGQPQNRLRGIYLHFWWAGAVVDFDVL